MNIQPGVDIVKCQEALYSIGTITVGPQKALLSDLLAVMFDTYGKTVKICRAMLGSGIEIRLNVEENRWNY